jgi:hypothetical protein
MKSRGAVLGVVEVHGAWVGSYYGDLFHEGRKFRWFFALFPRLL